MEPERLFRLSVWRPARLSSEFDYATDRPNEKSFVFKADRLQEQVYVWDPGANDIFLALDSDLAEQFREKLLGAFAPDLDPAKRSIVQLGKAIGDLISKLQKTKKDYWTSSAEPASNGQADDENLRFDAPLVLLNHLLWLTKVFTNVPGASVTIR